MPNFVYITYDNLDNPSHENMCEYLSDCSKRLVLWEIKNNSLNYAGIHEEYPEDWDDDDEIKYVCCLLKCHKKYKTKQDIFPEKLSDFERTDIKITKIKNRGKLEKIN